MLSNSIGNCSYPKIKAHKIRVDERLKLANNVVVGDAQILDMTELPAEPRKDISNFSNRPKIKDKGKSELSERVCSYKIF